MHRETHIINFAVFILNSSFELLTFLLCMKLVPLCGNNLNCNFSEVPQYSRAEMLPVVLHGQQQRVNIFML